MELAAYYANHHLIGEPDSRESEPMADFYVLDAAYTVLSARTRAAGIPIGASFFEHIPTGRAQKEELAEYLRVPSQKALLLCCTRTPVLFVGTVFAHTGLIFAILAPEKARRTLAFPAALQGVLEGLSVSRTAQMYHKTHTEAEFAAACRFCIDAITPFTYRNERADAPILPVLVYRAVHLAQHCGVRLCYDLSGLRGMGEHDVDVSLFTGVMLAATALAHRTVPDKTLRVFGAYEGAPVLYLELQTADPKDALLEFEPVLARATARGCVLDVVRLREDPSRVQVRAHLNVSELSVQGVRERHAFLEGGTVLSALPQATRILPDFPEIDLLSPETV